MNTQLDVLINQFKNNGIGYHYLRENGYHYVCTSYGGGLCLRGSHQMDSFVEFDPDETIASISKEFYDLCVELGISEPPIKLPKELIPVLAVISVNTCLSKSTWHEVVYHDGNKWCSYAGSKTFSDGGTVLKWKYASECFN